MRRLTTAQPSAGLRSPALSPALPPLMLAALALLTRLPFQSQMLYHWDSVNFARALEHFDVASGQPHAPGYPLYVVLGHLAAWLAGGAQPGYVLLASAGSAVAAVALYELGRQMWDAPTGIFAALVLLFSPLFWFYGEVALPHTLDGAAVTITALLCWRLWHGEHSLALPLAVWLGLIGGFRQQTLVFMFPLALLSGSRLPWRLMLAALAVLTLTVLAWLLPLLALSGGMQYFAHVRAYSTTFNAGTSQFQGAGWAGLEHNLDKLARYTLWGWAFAIAPFVAGAWAMGRGWPGMLRSRRLWFLLMWAAPCLAFYTLIHMGQQGLIFVYLPILALVSARGGLALGRRRGGWLLASCILANALLFLAAPTYLLPGRLKVLSMATIRGQDALLQAQLETARADLPQGAALLADEWRFPEYYAPELPLVRYQASAFPGKALDLSPAEVELIATSRVLAWYEPDLDTLNHSSERTTVLGGHDGVQLRVLRRSEDERFFVGDEGFGIVTGN